MMESSVHFTTFHKNRNTFFIKYAAIRYQRAKVDFWYLSIYRALINLFNIADVLYLHPL